MKRPLFRFSLYAVTALLLIAPVPGIAQSGQAKAALEGWIEQVNGSSEEELRALGLDEYRLGAFMRPAGDVRCSVADLARYGLAHLTGLSGQDGFLKAETVQELHRVSDQGSPYAARWGVDPESGQHRHNGSAATMVRPPQWFGRHNGSAGTFYSYLTIDPEAKIVVAFLTNAGPGDGQAAAQRAAEAILEPYSGE